MKKLTSVILTVVLVFSCLCVNAQISGSVHEKTSNIRIEGVANAHAGEEVTVYLVKKDLPVSVDTIGHVGQTTVGQDGTYTYKFKFDRTLLGNFDLKVKAGSEDITDDVTCQLVQGQLFTADLSVSGTSGSPYLAEGDIVNLNAKLDNLYGDAGDSCLVVYAAYDAKGRLIATNLYNTTADYLATDKTISNDIPFGAAKIKAFVWGNIADITPVSNSVAKTFDNYVYQDGDKVSFIGDSITAGVGTELTYPMYIEYFYQTRYPSRNISFTNYGIPNDTAYGGVNRLEWDVYSTEANKATVMFGFNDVCWSFNEGDEFKEAPVNSSATNLSNLIDKLKEKGIDPVIITPTISGYNAIPARNQGLTLLAEKVKNIALEKEIPCVDWNGPLNKIQNDNPTTKFLPDSIHPAANLQTVMAYIFLKEQGNSSVVANVTINTDGTKEAVNADVSDITATDSSIIYTYKPYALPLASTEVYQSIDNSLVPITEDLNREIINVNGLSEGNYTIKMNSAVIGTYSAEDLANGVNIATNAANPNQIQSAKVAQLSTSKDKRDLAYAIRHIAQMEQLMKGASVDYDSVDFVNMDFNSAQYTDNAVYNFFNGRNKVDAYYKPYAEYKKNIAQIKADLQKNITDAKALATPVMCVVEISKN